MDAEITELINVARLSKIEPKVQNPFYQFEISYFARNLAQQNDNVLKIYILSSYFYVYFIRCCTALTKPFKKESLQRGVKFEDIIYILSGNHSSRTSVHNRPARDYGRFDCRLLEPHSDHNKNGVGQQALILIIGLRFI